MRAIKRIFQIDEVDEEELENEYDKLQPLPGGLAPHNPAQGEINPNLELNLMFMYLMEEVHELRDNFRMLTNLHQIGTHQRQKTIRVAFNYLKTVDRNLSRRFNIPMY